MNVLPFLPEFHEKVRDGRKTATARSKPYGKEGGKVQGPGVVLVLEYVARWPLGTIASECFEIEGLESKEAFIEVWNRIHPTKRYDPATMVWMHRFHVEGRPPVCDWGQQTATDAKQVTRARKRPGGVA